MLDLLSAFLAFAVTMLALATIVTTLLEIVSRLSRRRLRVMESMIAQVFDEEIAPVLDRKLASRAGDARADFIRKILQTPYRPEADKSLVSRIGYWLIRLASANNVGDKSTDLATEDFIKRLAASEYGRMVHDEMKGRLDQAVERISRRYDDVANGAREYFKNSSAVASLVIGILVALALNVDAYRILTHFIASPESARQVAGRAEEVVENYEAAQVRLQAELANVADANGDEAQKKAAEDLAEIRKSIEGIKGILDQSVENDVPVGFSYFPHCTSEWSPACKAGESTKLDHGEGWIAFVGWLVRAILSGILIGLGGPFWYDTVRGLMRVTQMMRGRSDTAGTGGASTPATPAPVKTVTETFRQSMPPQPAGKGWGGPLWRPLPQLPETPASVPTKPDKPA